MPFAKDLWVDKSHQFESVEGAGGERIDPNTENCSVNWVMSFSVISLKQDIDVVLNLED